MLFPLPKHYLDLCVSDTVLKLSQPLYCFTTSMCHGFENYLPRLWGMGISAIFRTVTESGNSAKNWLCLIYKTWRNKFSNTYMYLNPYVNKSREGLFEDFRGQNV